MTKITSTIWNIEPHTEEKHEILRKYLDAWLPIMTRWNGRVLYIDGFAGPGEYIGGKWRLVLFDIPEKNRLFRDILRGHLQTLKFLKLQYSVFISPHPFEKPILELISLYSAQPYVRVVTATNIDNETVIKRHFFKR
ncbi:MAG: hypothetical protein COZ28_01740 [Candidatus Moranbacteria bacterium CG_4_10_14_3_um_filter_44_15]|nr:MAG: hypothetical protein COS72_03135 [Candidatus Moranbacteria bacterium CG06_land_8_20_14_3_00_43_56]PIV84129.1 MAG: hypothetical protein COW51_01525 [Candidatus Moranbacteria bacterium CG17_big_fil_post_rev_8_21_14_2_50_44_12]PIX90841.1 MAG: hypothetical protein COZ28_01740 [Candidatus Moranbacteria bacterium CG_4_10_14_3_um_filter_44_15]PJA85480.1 MAG: hypothetical protein CO142_03830 [Candidatus Moranbacteria bacterium CG_4_9_14_3_um_filter_44_28]